MFGEETDFEKQLKAFEAIEQDKNKNADETTLNETDVYPTFSAALDKGSGIEAAVVAAADLPDWPLQQTIFALLKDPRTSDDEKSELNALSKRLAPEESKTNEQEEEKVDEDTKSDLLDIANSRLGWSVAEQLKSILEDPTVEGIENAELNHNAIRLIYQFLKNRSEEEAIEAADAIEDWVAEDFGDPDILESKTTEQEEKVERENKMTVSNDPIFEKVAEDFRAVEDDPNKNEEVKEEEVKEDEEVLSIDAMRKVLADFIGDTDDEDVEEIYSKYISKTNEQEVKEEKSDEEVKEAQRSFTKQEIHHAIEDIKDRMSDASVDDFQDKESYDSAMMEWEAGIEKLEDELLDAPEEESKEVKEEEVPAEISMDLALKLKDAWELIGSHDDDPHVRSMSDEKVEKIDRILDIGQSPEPTVPESKEVDEASQKKISFGTARELLQDEWEGSSAGNKKGLLKILKKMEGIVNRIDPNVKDEDDEE